MPHVTFTATVKPATSRNSSEMRSGKRVHRSIATPSSPTDPIGLQVDMNLETLNPDHRNVQFHISAVEGVGAMPRSPMSSVFPKKYSGGQRLVHVFYEGEDFTGHEHTDPAAETYSMWSENLAQIGPVTPSDKFLFRLEHRSPIPGLRNRQNFIASTKEYTLEALLVLQGKQGVGKDVRLPLTLSDGTEPAEALLAIQIREPTTWFVSQKWLKDAQASSPSEETPYHGLPLVSRIKN